MICRKMTTQQTLPPPASGPGPSARRRWPHPIAMIALAAAAGIAAIVAADWLMLSPHDADERHIAFERTERRLRANLGMALRGAPDLANLQSRLAGKGLREGAPVLMRIFKREFELELWMARDGVFHHFATYPICRWSGRLGPKLKTGDGQAPEGFYTVTREALNPNSRWYRSLNLGFPNAYDRSHGRTGSFLMVHGGCASIGCYAMTDNQMDEIWRLINAAFDNGQSRIQVQAYPFRMSPGRLAGYQDHPDALFWRDLQRGDDLFGKTLLPPQVNVCKGRYVFTTGRAGDPGSPIVERCPQASARN